jgi:hypothetical protein
MTGESKVTFLSILFYFLIYLFILLNLFCQEWKKILDKIYAFCIYSDPVAGETLIREIGAPKGQILRRPG